MSAPEPAPGSDEARLARIRESMDRRLVDGTLLGRGVGFEDQQFLLGLVQRLKEERDSFQQVGIAALAQAKTLREVLSLWAERLETRTEGGTTYHILHLEHQDIALAYQDYELAERTSAALAAPDAEER